MPILSVNSITVSEADAFADIVVRLDAPATTVVTVSYATADATAYDRSGFDRDYQSVSGSLSFAPGETSKTVRVSLRDSAAVDPHDIEGTEWFRFQLSNPVGGQLANDGAGWVTVIDNDTVVPVPELHVSDVLVDETATEARFVVTLGRTTGTASNTPVQVNVSTVDGSARAGQDYVSVQSTLVFAPGETAKTVTVPLLGDTLAEAAESFTLQLSQAQGATLGRAQAQASIGANDAAAAPRPLLQIESAVWSEGTPWLEVPVTLSAPSAQRITVRWQALNDSAVAATTGSLGDFIADPGLLSFEPGQTMQVLRLRMSGDLLRADNASPEQAERFALLLSEPTNAALAHEGLAWVTVIDNDETVAEPLIHAREVWVDESAGQAVFAITLGRLYGQAASQPVVVQVDTADGSAKAGVDYLPVHTTLTFHPGETVHTVAVPLVNDGAAEGDETLLLTLSQAQGGLIGTASTTATIVANDAAPAAGLPVLSVQPQTISEADRWADVVVRLSAPSAGRVTVGYATDVTGSNGDVGYQSGSLVFEPGETLRVLTLDITGAVADALGQEDWERFAVKLSSPTGATLAAGGAAWIDIVDNDSLAAHPAVTVHDVLVNEGAQTADFVITLGRNAGSSTHAPLTLHYSTRDGSAQAGLDFVATQGTLTFLPGESAKTVRVPLVDDRLLEGLESFDLVVTGTAIDGSPLGEAGGAVIAPSDLPAKALPSVSALPAIATEDQPYADLWVTLDAPSARSVSVKWDLQSGSADTRDYYRGSGTLVFDPGVTALPVRVRVVSDTSPEPVETLKLVLSSPQGATLGSASASLSLVDAQVGSVPVQALGAGDDRYESFAATDIVIELPFGGRDTLVAHADATLPAQVEVLVLAAPAQAGTGNDEANTFAGSRVDNRFDGRGGIDTVVYAGPAASYAVTGSGGNFTVSGGDAGRDTLVSIERLQFADQVQAWDTTAGGRAFTVAALLNAGLNQLPDMAMIARWTAAYDTLARDLGTASDLAQQLLNTYVPGGIDNAALVAHLWQSLVGAPIATADLAVLVGLLNNGTYSQASLLALAAEHPLNTADLAPLVGQPWTLDASWFPLVAG